MIITSVAVADFPAALPLAAGDALAGDVAALALAVVAAAHWRQRGSYDTSFHCKGWRTRTRAPAANRPRPRGS